MEKSEVIERLSNIVSPLIGHTIGLDHIHTDENGWYYYIPAKSLQENHPLILNHYRGPLFMTIPFEDWKRLENEMVSIQEYVDNSVWSFGYYWGGGAMLDGVHWQPLEDGTGIHDTEKISRYLSILRCRTHHVSSGYMPSNETCEACPIEHCPFSKCEVKNAGASWKNEVQEVDDRKLFYRAVAKRIEERFGLKAVSCVVKKDKTISIYPGWEKNNVSVYLPEGILIDMLYNPGIYNIKELVNQLDFEVGIPWRFTENNEFVSTKQYTIPSDADVEFLYDHWKEKNVCNWFEKPSNVFVDTSIAQVQELSLMERITKFFKELF